MKYLKGALAVPFNCPLKSFCLYITFKNGNAAAGEHRIVVFFFMYLTASHLVVSMIYPRVKGSQVV